MLDIVNFRENPDAVREALRKRNMETTIVDQVVDLDVKRRELLVEVENLKAERNKVSKEIGKMKDPSRAQSKRLNPCVRWEIVFLNWMKKYVVWMWNSPIWSAGIPNFPSDLTPPGKDESENVVVKTVGEIPSYRF